jgi:hypothetical protein
MKEEGCHVIHSGVEILEWVSAAGSASAESQASPSLCSSVFPRSRLPTHPNNAVWCPPDPLPPPQPIPYI